TATAGTTAFFVYKIANAHGVYSLAVDVFDAIAAHWSTHYLLPDTIGDDINVAGAFTVGSKIIVASNPEFTFSNFDLDIYHGRTNRSSRPALPTDSYPDFTSRTPTTALVTFRPRLSSASHPSAYASDIYAAPSPAPALTANV